MATDLLQDFIEIETLAKEILKRHPRTIRRWMDQPNGLPYTRLGNRILVHIPSAREWLLGRMKRQRRAG